jgi:hypothetical protein
VFPRCQTETTSCRSQLCAAVNAVTSYKPAARKHRACRQNRYGRLPNIQKSHNRKDLAKDRARRLPKAAHYLSVKPVVVDIDPQTFKVRAEDVRAAITPNTILLVASAPSYSQGVIDPIAEIGRIAQEKHLLFHVDACVGGLHLSFMHKLG